MSRATGGRLIEVKCDWCAAAAIKAVRNTNRAARKGMKLYCNRACATLARNAKHRRSVGQKLWEQIEVAESGCWNWTGAILPEQGYGRSNLGRHEAGGLAHRASYIVSVGPIPKGLVLDHLCSNRRCINPMHLEPVSQRKNVFRAMGLTDPIPGECWRGHKYTADSVGITRGRRTACLVCKAVGARTNHTKWKDLAA